MITRKLKKAKKGKKTSINFKVIGKLSRALRSTKKYLYYVFHGGRGGGKTRGIAIEILAHVLTSNKKERVALIVRCTKDSAAISAFQEIKKTIAEYNLKSLFNDSQDKIICKRNGYTILSESFNSSLKIQSISGLEITWFEECLDLTKDDFNSISISTRGDRNHNMLILSFNPRSRSDFVSRRFLINTDDDALVTEMMWYDNPFFPPWLNRLRLASLKRDPINYRHEWEGGFKDDSETKVFDINKFNFYNEFNEDIARTMTSSFIVMDTACKEGASHDYSVIQWWGMGIRKGLILIDQVRAKWSFPLLVENSIKFVNKCIKRMKSIMNFNIPYEVFIEDKSSGISLIQQLRSNIEDFNVRAWRPKDYRLSNNKISRASMASVVLYDRHVYLPSNLKWVDGFLEELDIFGEDLSFLKKSNKKNIHDDQVDCFTMALSLYKKEFYHYTNNFRG